jgi:predicted Zn-dependent protease
MRKTALRYGLPALLVVGLLGCETNPVTGKKEFSLVSKTEEVAMGKEADPSIVAEYGSYEDAALQAYVEQVTMKLAKVSHSPELEWHVRVLDSPVVNAFALPGGYVYITRGILAHLESEAQMAGVLGHELGHVTARHTAQAVTRETFWGTPLRVIGSISNELGAVAGAAEQGLGLLFLKYGRDAEEQSDELGVSYSLRAGYDPRAIPATYLMLKRVSDTGGSKLPVFLSTHPDPGGRETRTAQLAAEAVTRAGAGKELRVAEQEYKQRIDGVVWGPDPRQGYLVGNRFYAPSLQFQMDFPDGWKVQNSPASVVSVNGEQTAAIEVTLASAPAGTAPAAWVSQLQSAKRVAAASGGAEKIGGLDAWVGTLQVATEKGSVNVPAAFVALPNRSLLQALGEARDEGNKRGIVAAFRSIGPIKDRKFLEVEPARVRVVTTSQAAPLAAVLESLGPLAASPEEIAVLNNLQLQENVPAGHRLKVVRPGKTPRP